MRIEINPKSLANLECISEVLYKLHPYVLDSLVDMERSLGKVLGNIYLDNLSLEEREFLANNSEKMELLADDSEEMEFLADDSEEKNSILNGYKFHNFRKYLQLDTYEYIPIKIYIEVEDPVIGRKVKELVETLEKTRAPEQFYYSKREMDEDAYFAEGYGLTMNEEQEKKLENFLNGEDFEDFKKLLKKEKLI